MTRSLRLSTLAFLFSLLSASVSAQQSLTGANVVAYDFASYTGAGFAPAPTAGQLDSDEWIARGVLSTMDLDFGGTSVNMAFSQGTSPGGVDGVGTGGIYAFTGVSTCRGTRTLLGVQPSNMTFSPGEFRLQVTNATGAPLTQLALAYTIAYFNDADRSVRHVVRVLDDTAPVGSVAVPSLDFETPVAAGAAVWTSECRGAVIDVSSLGIANGEHVIVEFGFLNGSGSGTRDELGITDVMVSTMPFGDGGVPSLDGGVASDAGPPFDAGPPTDGGASPVDGGLDGAIIVDGAIPPIDGGGTGIDGGVIIVPDGGRRDGGGMTRFDGGPRADGGGGPTDGGCGCSVPRSRRTRSALLFGCLGVGLALVGRARRRR